MISGAHVIVNSTNADADRAFFRDVLEYDYVDAGHGWLIFKLPPAELAFHPAGENDSHELYFMTPDVDAFRKTMSKRGVACSEVTTERWGRITRLTLPGGGSVGVYEPTHPSPLD